MGLIYRWFCHLCSCSLLILTIIGMSFANGINPFTLKIMYDNASNIDPSKAYGVIGSIALYFCQFVVLFCLPQTIFNFCGLLFYNAFPETPTVLQSLPKLPLLCFRVVTRGSYPELVHQTVSHNLQTCINVGLDNFTIEVVTDKSIQLPFNHRTREVVVPPFYCTKTGIMFKGRALQYALEDEVNLLQDDDWIVHLDEETLLTESSVRGIVRFASDNKHHFGQGLITYGKQKVVNWLLTLCDTHRSAEDMGKIRFQFSPFHKPFFGWKGSFIVAKFKAEKDVSFDHGPTSSLAEDCFFSMVAFAKGYSFEFIEGEMWEKSPFTVVDFLHQRKRWLQGILLTVHSPRIPFSYKILMIFSIYSCAFLPVAFANIGLAPLFPLPLPLIHKLVVSFIAAVNFYLCVYGAWICFSRSRLGNVKFVLCLIGSIAVLPFNLVFEVIAVLWAVLSRKFEFHIVDKKVSTPVCHSSYV